MRWITVDPVRDRMNWYHYCLSNLWDPLGLCDEGINDQTDIKIPQTPEGVNIDDNIKEAENMHLFTWVNKVREDGEWDYKTQGREYEEFGNFNYGATGRAVGFSEDTLLRAAGAVQKLTNTSREEWGEPWGEPPYGDDPSDQEMIKRGVEYYEQNKVEESKVPNPALAAL